MVTVMIQLQNAIAGPLSKLAEGWSKFRVEENAGGLLSGEQETELLTAAGDFQQAGERIFRDALSLTAPRYKGEPLIVSPDETLHALNDYLQSLKIIDRMVVDERHFQDEALAKKCSELKIKLHPEKTIEFSGERVRGLGCVIWGPKTVFRGKRVFEKEHFLLTDRFEANRRSLRGVIREIEQILPAFPELQPDLHDQLSQLRDRVIHPFIVRPFKTRIYAASSMREFQIERRLIFFQRQTLLEQLDPRERSATTVTTLGEELGSVWFPQAFFTFPEREDICNYSSGGFR